MAEPKTLLFQEVHETAFVHNLPEVHCCNILQVRLYVPNQRLQEPLFLEKREHENNVSIVLQTVLRDGEGLHGVRHEHEGRGEYDGVKLVLKVLLDLIEIQILDCYIFIAFEHLLRRGDVCLVYVYSRYVAAWRKFFEESLKRSPWANSNIKNSHIFFVFRVQKFCEAVISRNSHCRGVDSVVDYRG